MICDETREAFETWAKKYGFDTSKIGSDRSGTYESMFTRSMWWAWQDATKVERARCADIALRTVCDVHTPTGIKIYGTKAAKAILETGRNG